jgi:hypothetical protein
MSVLAEACCELFDRYPLAVRNANRSGTVRTMLLMLRDSGDSAEFFVLTRDCREEDPLYSLRPRRSKEVLRIGGNAAGDIAVNVVMHGIPIPRDRSLVGWRHGDVITTLVPVYTAFTPSSPEPAWVVMPRSDTPESQWPTFMEERFFGRWFWNQYRDGRIIYLGGLVAATADTVFWENTKAILGSDCCAVARDIKSSEGYTLRRGSYVYYEALRAGKPIPSLTDLLADTSKIDLAPRLRRWTNGDSSRLTMADQKIAGMPVRE